MFGTKGRRFMFVDTCHAAGAYNAKLGNEAYHNDITAFTATGQDEEALVYFMGVRIIGGSSSIGACERASWVRSRQNRWPSTSM